MWKVNFFKLYFHYSVNCILVINLIVFFGFSRRMCWLPSWQCSREACQAPWHLHPSSFLSCDGQHQHQLFTKAKSNNIKIRKWEFGRMSGCQSKIEYLSNTPGWLSKYHHCVLNNFDLLLQCWWVMTLQAKLLRLCDVQSRDNQCSRIKTPSLLLRKICQNIL